MYGFLKDHIDDIMYTSENLGFKSYKELLHSVKTNPEDAIWALTELLPNWMDKPYDQLFIEDKTEIDGYYVIIYKIKDKNKIRYFRILDYKIQEMSNIEKVIITWIPKNNYYNETKGKE